MKNFKIYHFLCFLILVSITESFAQFSPGLSTTPLPFYNKFKDGYAILRDGTRIDGTVGVGKKQLTIQGKDGTTYKIEDFSLREYGLNMETAVNYSPLKAYEWKDKKVKEYLYFGSNDDFNSNVKTKPQRGFIELKSGEIMEGMIELDGKVSIVGGFHSDNIFALDKLKYIDDQGNEKEYKDADLAGFGRVIPWNLSPNWMYKTGPAMMGASTKKKPGFVELHDGTRLEGEISLFTKFIQEPGSGSDVALPEFYKTVTINNGEEKIKHDIDEVKAFGQTEMSVNILTNNGTRSYPVDAMNFHRGSLETNGGEKKEGLLAFFPGPFNYYGIYFAENADDKIEIFALDELKDVQQNISEIEEFVGFGDVDVQMSANNNINGFIVNTKGEKKEGTIELNDATDWYCQSIAFTNKDNLSTVYGRGGKQIQYFVVDVDGKPTTYIQHKMMFIQGELDLPENIFSYFSNPFPESHSFMTKFLISQVQAAANNAMGNLENNLAAKGWQSENTGSNNVALANYAKMVSSEDLPEGVAKAAFKDELVVYFSSTDERMVIPKKSRLGGKTEMEVILEGCTEYHALDKTTKKSLAQYENSAQAVEFLNECYK